jgi:hypothetical protein
MPNRILKDSICTSDNLNKATPESESLFFRLIVNCDDYGRMFATPCMVRARCYPLRIDSISDKQIQERLEELQKLELLNIYEVDNRPYLQMITWYKHNNVRAKKSKFPPPNGQHLQTSANKCEQLQTNVPVFVSVFEDVSVSVSDAEKKPKVKTVKGWPNVLT